MLWNENQKLTWKDFRGKPVPSASFVASTNTGISFQYSYSIKNGAVNVEYSRKGERPYFKARTGPF